MTATRGYVQGPPDSTGKKVDTVEVTDSAGTGVVEREVSVLGDPENPAALAGVSGGERDREGLAITNRDLQVLDRIDHNLAELLDLFKLFMSDVG